MVPADSVASETTLCFRLMLSSPDSRPRIYALTAELLDCWGGLETRRPESPLIFIGLQSVTAPLFSLNKPSVISARVKQRKTFFNAYSLSLFSLLKELLLFSVTC
jgi:hypothetical protein